MAEIAPTVLDLWVCNAPDSQVDAARCLMEFLDGVDRYQRERGSWSVSMVQKRSSGEVVLTTPVRVTSSMRRVFRLGRAQERMAPDDPVYLRIVYSAADGPDPVFWTNITHVSVTFDMI